MTAVAAHYYYFTKTTVSYESDVNQDADKRSIGCCLRTLASMLIGLHDLTLFGFLNAICFQYFQPAFGHIRQVLVSALPAVRL